MILIKKTKISDFDNEDVVLIRLTNSLGSYVELLNYGATLVSVVVPDKDGEMGNVVLGFPNIDGYREDDCYIGSTVGRYANRIGNASFRIGEKEFELDKNDGIHSNHGGFNGFNTKLFDYTLINDGVCLSVESFSGESGFPGNVKFSVTYKWNNKQELDITYEAQTDKDTVLNFTNHAYFNLSALKENALQQELTIVSSELVECTPDFIPTGRIIPTADYSFKGQKPEEKVNWNSEGLKGINSYYIFDPVDSSEPVCYLSDTVSGRILEIFTTYPGVQLYTGDFLASKQKGNHGVCYQAFDGICLECQSYPDAPNHAHFPSTLLKEGSKFHENIKYRFSNFDRSLDFE